jgi:diadenosine tetraphosphate (Ap4A) HIT family hydrolase
MLATVPKINTDLVNDKEFNEMRDIKECVFCKPPEKKIFAETENFYITFDASPLLEGHVDLHTKDHIGCSAEIDPEIYEEFIELKKWVGEIITDIYGQVSFYEHGRAGHCSMTLNGVECHHFHMHALPLNEDISAEVSKMFKPIMLEDENDIPVLYERYDQYLYFENTDGEKFFYPANKPLPSHYLRTVIANVIGKPERSDWESYGGKESLNKFKRALAERG